MKNHIHKNNLSAEDQLTNEIKQEEFQCKMDVLAHIFAKGVLICCLLIASACVAVLINFVYSLIKLAF